MTPPNELPSKDELERQLLHARIRREQAERTRVEHVTRNLKLQIADHEQEAIEYEAQLAFNRVYNFCGEVNRATVETCINALDMWSRRDGEEESIKILFTSPGGSVWHGLALYDFVQELRRRGHHVTTVGYGIVASMGSVLLQAGDTRVMGRNAWFMIHEPSKFAFFEESKASEVMDEAELYKQMWAHLREILAERSTLNADEILQKSDRRDYWMRAVEALELGFIDQIDEDA